jgi:hypothetical protein
LGSPTFLARLARTFQLPPHDLAYCQRLKLVPPEETHHPWRRVKRHEVLTPGSLLWQDVASIRACVVFGGVLDG